MINRPTFQVISIFIFFILSTLIISCDFFARNGGLGVSQSIEDSKKRMVFVQKYKALQNPIRINDTLEIHIHAAWLEHSWRYSGYASKEAAIEKDSSYQLIVIADNNDLKGYNENWLISSNPDSTFHSGYDASIHTSLTDFPSTDTISWKVQSGNILGPANPKIIIGKFSLVKDSR